MSSSPSATPKLGLTARVVAGCSALALLAATAVLLLSTALLDLRPAMLNLSRSTELGLGAGAAGAFLLLLVAFGAYVVRAIVVPVRRIARATVQLAGGDGEARVSERGPGEIGQLARSFNAMAASLATSREEAEGERAALARALAELQDEKQTADAFSRFGEGIAGETSMPALARTVLATTCDFGEAEIGTLYVVDHRRGGRICLLAARGIEEDALPAELRPGSGMAGRAIAERRPAGASYGETGLKISAFGAEVVLSHELHVPLLDDAHVLGVVSLARVSDRPFSEAEVETIVHLADRAAAAFSRLLSYREAQWQATSSRAVLDATMEGMRLVDTRGDTLLENAVMERLAAELAVPASSESAESFADRTADPGAYRHSFLVESDPESETVGEYELADSGRVFQRRTTPVRDASGGLIGRLVAVREITSEREVDRLKDEFVATVSHELRTPLASILGYLSYLMRGKAGGFSYDQGRYLEVIDRNAGRLLGLVNDLLFVARMDAGTVALELEPLRLDEVVADSVQTSVPLAREKGIELVVDNGVPLEVAGDRGRLAQVVENLLSNAVKFTPGGGRVTVRALVHDGRAVLEVEDSGIGIPDSERQYLFRRFFRASTATARKIQGTGLGLSIAKTIVELHAGTIAFQSREGEGTTFRVELPLRDRGDTPTEPAEALPAIEVGATLAETHEQPGEAANDEASHQPEATGVPEPSGTDAGSNGHCAPAEPDDAGRRNGHAPAADRGPTEERPFVVIADDDRDVRELLALELRGLGYEVAIVGDGREALERIRARHPDACVLDWMMPVASGPEVCEQLKADPGTAGIPVVLLTARATQHDVTRGFEYGADDYLTKPFEVEELDQALRRLLHPHARV